MYWDWAEIEMTITEKNITINSELLNREVTCTLLIPDELEVTESLNLLLLNDGQELENLELIQTLEKLYGTNRIKPVLVVAIHAGEDRIQEYGVAGKPDFKKRGSKADVYTAFIKDELLPQVKLQTGISDFETTAYAGFSLGGLSAFDITWNNADVFDKVGVFSGSFWWRSKDLAKGYTEADRIMHAVIKDTAEAPGLKFWLQTGTKDETTDRNKNGIIDAIDDTIDLIKALENKGYTRPADIQYVEIVGGSHDTATWAKAMHKFLTWAFGR
ncbi:alpha/beta hydrolase [Mucilaginibacter pocheonensis]|uniref:Enterochelin esterase-like enzyme n=1 Tax=Mucilaginibacter pocheonensis TaxID=398050 RepID=A0ABU1TBM9_9SPHI|nr:alpha/beta hydrolase-fold protein [Mucilaginibacter pocheonensis]MDR6942807.1 enterochelin esterase-like enzyme [Mucilaginibacter pocheonensis]